MILVSILRAPFRDINVGYCITSLIDLFTVSDVIFKSSQEVSGEATKPIIEISIISPHKRSVVLENWEKKVFDFLVKKE